MAQVYDVTFNNKCVYCKSVVEITEGAVLYDSMWYHQKCWDDGEKDG